MGIPSRRRACLVAGRGSESRWSTQRLNDLDSDPPTRYASGADATGYPLPWVTHHYPCPALEPSRSEARRRRLCLV